MESPRWLSPEEQGAWRAFLAATELLDDALDRQLQTEAGMTHAGYAVLVALSETPGRSLRMNELAWLTNSSQSRLSHLIARQEQRGWVRRERCPTDRRGNIAVLTDAGFEALRRAAPGHVAAVRRLIFDRLTPAQVGQLGTISRELLGGLDPDGQFSAWRTDTARGTTADTADTARGTTADTADTARRTTADTARGTTADTTDTAHPPPPS